MKWDCQFLLCPLSDHLPSISAQSTLNITVPFQAAGMWLLWRYLSKKGLLPADSYGRVSPKQSPPLAQGAPLYAAADLSPALNYHYAAAAQILDFLKLHWWWWSAQCGRGKGSVRTSSWHSRPSTTCHLLNGSSWHCSLRPTQIEQKNDTKGTFILLKQCSFNMMNDPHTYSMPKMFFFLYLTNTRWYIYLYVPNTHAPAVLFQ